MKLPAGKGRILAIAIMVAALLVWPNICQRSNLGQVQASAQTELPVVGNYQNLLKLLERSQSYGRNYELGAADAVKSTAEASAPQAAGNGSDQSSDYSGTNLQVEGVDEADLVKTDGTYLYQINGSKVNIIKAQPAYAMGLASSISSPDQGFQPVDLYVDGDHLIIIGTISPQVPYVRDYSLKTQIYPPIRYTQMTRAILYNIADKSHPVKLRELELEGSYLTSRKIDSSFYLLTNKYINYYYIQQQDDITPVWRDSIQGDELRTEKLEEIRYFPDCVSPNYLMIAAIDLNKPTAPADIDTYLGSGQQVYASAQNLYVAVQKYEYPVQPQVAEPMIYRPADTYTTIYKFQMRPGQVEYYGSGQVPGRILNQFSMDEYEGYFRLATTSGEVWSNDQYTSSNNVYVLDSGLQVCGRLENIAPGERIYSTRFMGKRAYMVTFKQVDPFFVIDLSNPGQPAILGKLKIPGYSDYLHPYDENHIIGFGKDTIETKGWGGQTQAFYQGMKVALFDVTDVTNPIEISKVLIGDRGTESELLRNHKALMFSAARNLLGFPVTVMEVSEDNTSLAQPFPAYGSFAFQGYYVYNIDVNNGLQLQGRITHLSGDDYLKAGDSWYDSSKNIERGLYIGNILYTLSQDMVKANDLETLSPISTLYLK